MPSAAQIRHLQNMAALLQPYLTSSSGVPNVVTRATSALDVTSSSARTTLVSHTWAGGTVANGTIVRAAVRRAIPPRASRRRHTCRAPPEVGPPGERSPTRTRTPRRSSISTSS